MAGGDPERPWLARYPAGVPSDVTIPPLSLFELIDASVARYAERTAFIYYGARWSYQRFWEAAGHFAAALAREGLKKGDRLALYLPNCPAYPIAYYAAMRLGLVVVQVSPLYIGQDLLGLLRDSEPKAIVTLDIHYPNLAKISSERPLPTTYVVPMRELYPLPARLFVNRVLRRKGFTVGTPRERWVRRWREALRAAGPPPPAKVDPAHDVAVLQYTGGTTGLPKGAMLSHRNLIANVLQLDLWLGKELTGPQVHLASIPYFHVYGMTAALNYPLYSGGTIVLQTRPDVDEILKLIDRYRPTFFPGVPALYNAINNHPKRAQFDISCVRICVSGSAPLPLEVARRFEELTGSAVVEGYGLSETSPVTHVNPIHGERRPGSVGLPLPGTEQKVLDPEDGVRPLPAGEAGELWLKGPQVMLGYYRQPEETAAVLKDGWFATGDIGYLDADGYCFLIDRKKDTVNVGGLKVYPREVEEVLFQHPAVADAAVVGVPDARLGEVVRAYVVRKAGATVTEAELIEFVKERIAHYKAPRAVEFRESLPRSGVQKVLRRTLREDAIVTRAPAR